ncbi:hypothetical protein, partial [Helicobacter pylori]|uniref:hypothetical protein n=1 Tax=Helicobacter pylori TaxID=210 RepID=UPI0013046551
EGSGWHSVRRHTHEVRCRCDSFTSCSGSFDTATTLKNTPRVTALGGLAIATIIPSFAFQQTK